MTFEEFAVDLSTKKNLSASISVVSSMKPGKKDLKVDMHVDQSIMPKIMTNKTRVVIIGFDKSIVHETDAISLLKLMKNEYSGEKALVLPHQSVVALECNNRKNGLTYKLILENKVIFDENKHSWFAFTWDA